MTDEILHYDPESPGEYWRGRPVRERPNVARKPEGLRLGHIVGWGPRNSFGETTVRVQWEGTEEHEARATHYKNVELL